MFDFIWDFIVKYYLTGGYNIVNTVTYGLFLGVVAFKVLIPVLRPVIGRIDRLFILMVLPFIVYGSTMREMVDQELGVYAGHTSYPGNWLFVSPGIYFTMFAITGACMLVGLLARRLTGVDYRIVASALGFMLMSYNFVLLVPRIRHPETLVAIIEFFLLSCILVWCLRVLLSLRFLGFEWNMAVVLAHMFDASTTFVGVDLLGLYEKHVVPTLFINVFHTAAVMYPLKLLILLPALKIIDEEMADDEFGRRFVKFVILVLGAGPAIRNTVLMLLG